MWARGEESMLRGPIYYGFPKDEATSEVGKLQRSLEKAETRAKVFEKRLAESNRALEAETMLRKTWKAQRRRGACILIF